YAQLALATLAGIAELTGSQAAVEVYNTLLAQNAPFTSEGDFSRDPTFAITAPDADNTPLPLPTPQPSAPIVSDPVDTPADGGSDTPSVDTPQDNGTSAPPADKPQDEGQSSSPVVDTPRDEGQSSSPVDPATQKFALAVLLGGDAWQGNPEAAISVDGQEVYRGEVVARGQAVEVALGELSADAAHVVEVTFLNDAWGGSEAADRNLRVEDVHLDGVSTGESAALDGNGSVVFQIDAQQQMDHWFIG
ncbi:carbohydrate-binding domain-containing protein, partial [Pseudoroseomonas ludipueritiae]